MNASKTETNETFRVTEYFHISISLPLDHFPTMKPLAVDHVYFYWEMGRWRRATVTEQICKESVRLLFTFQLRQTKYITKSNGMVE